MRQSFDIDRACLRGGGRAEVCVVCDFIDRIQTGKKQNCCRFLLLLEPPLHYGEGKCCSKFRRWGRRYAAHFTAVGAGVTLPKMFGWYLARIRTFTQLCCPFYSCWCRFYTTDRVHAGQIFGVGVGVMLPILQLLVPLVHYG